MGQLHIHVAQTDKGAENVEHIMDASKIGSLTTFLAVWGAILSSITFGWTLFRDLRDKAKFHLNIKVRRIGVGANGMGFAVSPSMAVNGASQELHLVVRVVNVGRRPMLWEGWGGKYFTPQLGKTGFFIVGENLPKMLAEHESHSETTVLEEGWIDNVKTLFVWNASGKHWKLSGRKMEQLRSEAKKALAENTPQATDESETGGVL